MADDRGTIADPTALWGFDQAGAGRPALIVYLPEGDALRTRLFDLPDACEIEIGRSRSCAISIDSERVSRNHAIIQRRGDRVALTDLDSRNGTRVNGAKITGEHELDSGDQIDIGPATIIVSAPTRLSVRPALKSTTYLDDRLTAECDRGHRYQRPFALVMLRLEGATASVDQFIDDLTGRVRPMDTVCEYGPDELALLLPEADSAAGRTMVGELLAAIPNRGDVTVRTGLAVFPEHAVHAGELISRSRAALATARRERTGDILAAASDDAQPSVDGRIIVDPKMKHVYSLVDKVAGSGMTVLIAGETGSGKEVIAEAIHQASPRRSHKFVRLNCACLPETLLESELFGHEKGSFTGADRLKVGYFEAASGGTLFLDEIGEVSLSMQPKLLRALEEHKIIRVGGTSEISVDVRVVCATNRDLEAEVRAGRFREDLFFRISAFTLMVPPLRDRKSELRPLAEFFLGSAASDLGVPVPQLSAGALAALEAHNWPGNVRELRNAMERAVVLASGTIERHHLPERISASGVVTVAQDRELARDGDMQSQIADVERAAIVAALEATGGNQTRAADRLGITRRALIYRMEKHGLKSRPQDR